MALSSITHIPNIMWAKGWTRGFMLMERWFSTPPFIKPFYASPDLTTIKMNWVLTFDRAQDTYDDMVKDKVWSNDAARPIMAANLRKLGVLRPAQGKASTIGFNLAGTTTQYQHDLQVNFRKVGGYHFDDLTAALGHFSIYVTPLVGEVKPVPAPWPAGATWFEVKLSKIGFHVKDSYDFEGNQYLGHWDEAANRVSNGGKGQGPGDVYNETFRDWRTANKRGGDFEVYSDVQEYTLNPPDVFFVV